MARAPNRACAAACAARVIPRERLGGVRLERGHDRIACRDTALFLLHVVLLPRACGANAWATAGKRERRRRGAQRRVCVRACVRECTGAPSVVLQFVAVGELGRDDLDIAGGLPCDAVRLGLDRIEEGNQSRLHLLSHHPEPHALIFRIG